QINLQEAAPPGWYADPEGRGQRYWDGSRWTEYYGTPGGAAAHVPATRAGGERSTMAVVALCLGLAGVLAAGAMNILFWLGWTLGATAIVLGLLARKGVRRTMAGWAAALGLVAIGIGIYGASQVSKAVTDLER